MTQEELRKYIVTILLDIRGDNEYPEDNVLQANASLLLREINQHVAEVIGFDTEGDHLGNRLRAEQRKRAGL